MALVPFTAEEHGQAAAHAVPSAMSLETMNRQHRSAIRSQAKTKYRACLTSRGAKASGDQEEGSTPIYVPQSTHCVLLKTTP